MSTAMAAQATATDPVCGMDVTIEGAAHVARHDGDTHYFCSARCREKFVADPANPKRLDPALQRGDNLHPDGRGQTRIGEAVPLDIFE